MPETPDFERREMPIAELQALWPVHGQRNNQRIVVGNTVVVDADQWVVTDVRVSTAIIARQPPEKDR
jgi:hypothetical protein